MNLNFLLFSPFRDIIKDVTVTLTPLTDFEKEIEKSSKKVSPETIFYSNLSKIFFTNYKNEKNIVFAF